MISTAAIIFTYLLIMLFLCWSVIYSKGRTIYKCIGAAVALWFSLSFFYVLPDLKGWPAEISIPDKSRIIALTIVEPDKADPGAFYFWCDIKPDNLQSTRNLFNPYKRFTYTGAIEPRAYKMPYDRELHKKLLEAQKKKARMGGSWIEIVKGKEGQRRDEDGVKTDKVDFKIVNPIEFLRKDNDISDEANTITD